MSNYVSRRLKWFRLLGMILLVTGLVLGCIVALRTSAWMVEWAGRPDDYYLNDDNATRWMSSVEIDKKLHEWAIVLVPLGAGSLLGSIASLAWVTKGRFRLRSLFFGMTILCLVFGTLFGIVRPRLQNPRLIYRPATANVVFEQHREPAANCSYPVLNYRMALVAAVPLVVLPIILYWPPRVRPPTAQP